MRSLPLPKWLTFLVPYEARYLKITCTDQFFLYDVKVGAHSDNSQKLQTIDFMDK